MISGNPVRAALLCNLALLLFACMDTTTKYLTAHFEVPLVVAARYIGNVVLMLLFIAPTHGREMVWTQRTALVWVRGGCLAASSLLIGFSLQRMPVAETTAIMFLSPVLVVLAAGRMLHEQIGLWGWGAVLLGFGGVMLVVRPGSGLDLAGVLMALAAAALSTSYQLLSRTLAASERTLGLLFYSAAIGAMLFSAALPWFWAVRVPTLLEASLLTALGALGGMGHYLFTAAFRYAPASILAPMTYLQLLWAAALGWMVFHHAPDAVSVLGMLIVGASGVMVALRSRYPS
ncbi:MAG: permease [Sphingobium sp. 66-54]|nr:MAG: permease [Sphingobium sp. 66-54]